MRYPDLLLPPYSVVAPLEGKGNWAVDRYYKQPYAYFYQQKLKMVVRALGGKHYNNILDYGAGQGIFTPELQRHATHVVSVDNHYQLRIMSKFDVIVCASVLEFVPDVDKLLDKFLGIMSPNSSIIVASPQDNLLTRAYFKLIGDKMVRHSHYEIAARLFKKFNVVYEDSWMGLYFCIKAVKK